MNSVPVLPPDYNSKDLLVRDPISRTFERADPKDFHALIPSPAFAGNWAELALRDDPHANLLTASLDLSDGCPI